MDDRIEPQPVTQNGSGEASKRACSPLRRRSPRSLTAARASASTRSLATTAPTAIVKALLLNVPAWLSPPRAGSNVRHEVGAPAERTERQPAAEVLAERGHVRRDAEQHLGATDAQARRHHLVEDQHRAARGGQRPQHGEERRVARDAAAGAQHRLDEHARDVVAVGREGGLGRRRIVVRQDDVVERDAQRRPDVAEVQRPAVVAVVEHDDLAAARDVAGRHQGHHVGLGARVREADLLDRRVAGDDSLGEDRLRLAHRAVGPAPVEHVPDRVGDDVAPPEQPGRVVAEQVDVVEPVGVVQHGAVGPDDAEGERVDVQHGAGVATGQDGTARSARARLRGRWSA